MGEDERTQGVVTVKPLRAEGGLIQQDRVSIADAAAVICGLLKRRENKDS